MTINKFASVSTLVLATFLASGAYAADLNGGLKDSVAGVRVQNWSGVYLGVQGGFGETTVGTEDDQGGIAANGGIIGLRAGIDVARGPILFGVYGEYNFSNESLDLGGITLVEQDSDWSAMGRVGFIHGNTLFYGTGGYTEIEYSTPLFGGASADVSGWKAGVGIEHAIAPNFTVALEATRAWLDVDDAFPGAEDFIDATDDRVMARVSYKINGYTFGF